VPPPTALVRASDVPNAPPRPRYLDPASRLGEVLFGLVMVLSVTLTTRFGGQDGPAGMRQLVVAALGCNLAWALIDGIMYVMAAVTERAEKASIFAAAIQAADERSALALIRDKMIPRIEMTASPKADADLALALREYILAGHPPRVAVQAEDLKGAAACFCLVFLSCLPVVVLYAVMPDPQSAVRASNALLLAALFAAGAMWGRMAGVSVLWAGFSMLGIGLALVATAVALGG
jgi:hypothetical protein